jgi:hypothetical protein
MTRVGTRLHVQADDAAQAVAVLGVDAVLGDGDLVHGVHRGCVGRLIAGAQRYAVEQDVIRPALAAAAGIGAMFLPPVTTEVGWADTKGDD